MSEWTNRSQGSGADGLGLLTGIEHGGLSLAEVWWRYIAIGGQNALPAFADEVAGMTPLDDYEHDLIAHAINESLLEHGVNSFPVEYASTASADRLPTPMPRVVAMHPADLTDRASARERAIAARQRSANASRQAALLQLSAARLLIASGQIRRGRRTLERSELAQARFEASQISG